MLVRHGETAWNAEKRAQGVTDIPLNETGRRQAQMAAESLASRQWDQIYSSPLSRAAETARIIADSIGIAVSEICYDDRLVERSFGKSEGMTKEERELHWPDVSDVPGGEDWAHVGDRGAAVLSDLVTTSDAERIVVAAHGGLIKSTLSAVTGGLFSDTNPFSITVASPT